MPEDTPNPAGDGAQPPVKTFTQEDLDRIVKERLERERSKYADYDALRDKAAKFDRIDSANKSEAEKVAQALADRDTRLAELEAKAKESEERAIGATRQIKVVAAASILGAYDPSDPNFAAAVAGIDPASSTADADIKAALEALKAAKPYLFRTGGPRPLESFNPGSGQGSAETDAQRLARLHRKTGVGVTPFG